MQESAPLSYSKLHITPAYHPFVHILHNSDYDSIHSQDIRISSCPSDKKHPSLSARSIPIFLILHTGSYLSVCKSDYLIINIDRCRNTKGNDATWLGVSDIDIAHYGQIRMINCVYQYLFIFLHISFIHRLSYENT